MDLNGVNQSQQQPVQQTQQQPVQQPVAQPTQIGGTQFQPVNPGQQQIQPQQPVQQTQAQPSFNDLRQEIANSLGYSIDQVPNDPRLVAQYVKGGLGAIAELQRMKQQSVAPTQPQQTQAQPNQQFQTVQMPPGWQQVVTFDQQSQTYQPTHPFYDNIARAANQNYAAERMKGAAVQSGQLLPEHEQKIDSIVEQRLNERLEAQRQQDFINQHGNELFQHDQNGNRVMQFNPQTGKQEPVMSEFGLAFNAAADELVQSGARFDSQHRLAQLAFKMTKDRMKATQPQTTNGVVNGRPPSQVVNQDLATLFQQHNTNNTQRTPNVNGSSNQYTGDPKQDFRTEALNRFAAAGLGPQATGLDYARALGMNV